MLFLINLSTNSYKFTIKGHIVVRAVSIPKEKKIRILVKDSGKGFNPKEFKIYVCATKEKYQAYTLEELLPHSFGPEHLI